MIEGDAERWARLPVWAQQEHSRVLKERLAYEVRLLVLETDPGTGPGDISHGDHRRPWRGIPRGDRVRFRVGDGREFEVVVENDGLVVTLRGAALACVPSGARNAIRIEPR